jgi:hypothetical protein
MRKYIADFDLSNKKLHMTDIANRYKNNPYYHPKI